MAPKLHLGIIFGGRSAEHEVSIQSARNIIEALDRDKYELTLIGIDRDGQWYLNDTSHFLLSGTHPELLKLNQASNALVLKPGSGGQQLVKSSDMTPLPALDVVFPVLHGTYGEDGAVQGLLRMAGVPFVGSGVLGSAVGMDKDVMKRLLLQAGIPTPKWVTVYQGQALDQAAIIESLGGFPLFVKPANLGSSVGIHKVKSQEQLAPALADAFCYDHKVLIEQGLEVREIECSVLGNQEPIVSLPGEIKVQAEFYSYEAKYIDESGALLEIPAKLPPETIQLVQDLAVKAFRVLNAEGLARVDCFLTPDGQVWVNEINTLPGFTRISMYPKLWEASGIGYRELLDRLIELALERDQRQKNLKTSR
ncbi:MAG: D-alanine--D-alanine ligase [Candidatus Melainabacteria bacterium HGW-Melainabacteria-1]|nr:MAG: D-alanine--D-alanine ligase [Candidatus Melainabacteria bacterium HGW-Melainabacteria-1]